MKEVLLSKKNGVAEIRLNRPDRQNAINLEMALKLIAALRNVERDKKTKIVIITGVGKGFCSGQDLGSFSGKLDANAAYEYLVKYYKPVILSIQKMEKPIICAVNGAVAGAGIGIMMACDYRLMSADAVVVPAFSKLGLIPDAGVSWFFVKYLGYGRAFEILVNGRKLSADECLKVGLVHCIVLPEDLAAKTEAVTEYLSKRPLYAIGLTKKALHYAEQNSLEATIEFEAKLQQQAVLSEDFRNIVSKISSLPKTNA
jgi:2-(1,2-epoxy-1,2-dihydrophenyl)acetyl-CoA isomerase